MYSGVFNNHTLWNQQTGQGIFQKSINAGFFLEINERTVCNY